MMRWHKKHPRGTRQPLIMSTGRFCASHGWLKCYYWPYIEACKAIGTKPVEQETLYHLTCGSLQHTPMEYAQMTKDGTLPRDQAEASGKT